MIFTVPAGSEVTPDLIRQAIEANNGELSRYKRLFNYYNGDHDILYRTRPITSANEQLVVNHAKYISDKHTSFMVGRDVEYSVGGEYDIEPIMDEYKHQTIAQVDYEIGLHASVFGRSYGLVYASDNDIKTAYVDPRMAVVAYDDTVEHSIVFGVVYSSDTRGNLEAVRVWDNKREYEAVMGSGKVLRLEEVGEHSFGGVPLVEYENDIMATGDFEQVMALIDAYNLLQSDRINDKEQLVDALLVGYGITLETDQKEEIKQNRMMFSIPKDSRVEYLIKQFDEGQVDILRQTIEDDIHKISMTPNMTDEKFSGNTAGVALRYKLFDFVERSHLKQLSFKKALRNRFELYNNYLVRLGRMGYVPSYDVEIRFKSTLPQNDLETAQIIAQLERVVDDETLVSQLSFIQDASVTIEKNKQEEQEKMMGYMGNFGTDKPTEEKLQEKVDNEVHQTQKSLIDKLMGLVK